MTMQFLASVRRNQKQWMVVLTILAIFAFLFDDVVRGANNLSATSMALFFAVLCGGGMSIIGYSRRHTVLYGAIGFVAGGGAALIGSSFGGPKPLVRTNAGNLTEQKIVRLRNDRIKVHRFLASAVEKATKQGRAYTFGQLGASSMVEFAVLHHEAKRMGVSVSNDGINRFIQEQTQEQMSRKDYLDALRDVDISESELLELLRAEMEVQLVKRLLVPPSNSRFGGAILAPEQLWENYRRLNVRQALTTMAVPVSEFVKLVPAPSESELREYFDKRKNFVGDDRGNPGFLELPKVKLAYLVASNVEAYEKGATKPTDQEIVDYYVKHKREFQIFDIPDFPDSKLPDSNLPDLKGADPHAPADALVPANTAAEQPVDVNPAPGNPPTGEKPAVEKPAVEKPAVEKPAVEKPAVEKPADKPLPEKKDPEKKDDEKPASDDPSKSDPKCGDDPVTKPAATEGDDAKPADEKVNLPKPAAEKGSETPPAPALPTSEADDAHSKLAPPSFSPMNFGPMAPPKFRELDDDLKRDISEKVLLEKASARMSDAADAALAFMMDLNQKYAFAEKADQDKIVSTFADACRQYAEEKGLEYHETREMTRQELELSLNEKIGTASESVSERSSRRNPPRVVDLVFDMVGRNYRISLYSPQRADLPNAKYAYWKTADIASRVPELTNDVTHRLVVDSWEFEKARVLAETRARELAELVKKSPTDIPGALSGQTVNGKPESPAVTVHEAPKFSWLRVSSSVPTMMSFGRPEESSISGIEGAGSDFMKLIFEQLGDGDVGVGLNRAKTAFYVVRVHDRDGSSSNDGGVALQELQQQFLNERFTNPRGFPTPYDYLSSEVQQFVFEHWKQNFSKRFAISFEGPLQESDEE